MRPIYSIILAGLLVSLLIVCGCVPPIFPDYYEFVGLRVEDTTTKNAIPNAKVYFDRNGYNTGSFSEKFNKEKLQEMRALTTDNEGIGGELLRLNLTTHRSEKDLYPDFCVVAEGYEVAYGSYRTAPQCNQKIDLEPYFKAQNKKHHSAAIILRVIQLKRSAK